MMLSEEEKSTQALAMTRSPQPRPVITRLRQIQVQMDDARTHYLPRSPARVRRPLRASIIPLPDTLNHHLMFVVNTDIGLQMVDLTITEASHLTIIPNQPSRDFIMPAPEGLILELAHIYS